MSAPVRIAKISFVGGSLVPIGGHNLLEPASFGIPVLFGPHIHNFVAMSELLIGNGGGLRIQNSEELLKTMNELLSDQARCEEVGRRAREFVRSNRGALERVVGHIERLTETG